MLLPAFALMNLAVVYGQTLPKEVIGCANIGCPFKNNQSTLDCKVVDKSFSAVGLARIPTSNPVLSGFSWSHGVAITREDPYQSRSYGKTFYLGTPPNVDLNGTGSCAVLWNKAHGIKFPTTDLETGTGQCRDLTGIDPSCLGALTQMALSLDVSNLSSQAACRSLFQMYKNSTPKACENLPWDGITTLPLSGPPASPPINSTANSTSNCWPITPKNYNLSLVDSIEPLGDWNGSTIDENLHSVTPIVTLFWPGNGTLFTKPEAQFTCMKLVTLGFASLLCKVGFA